MRLPAKRQQGKSTLSAQQNGIEPDALLCSCNSQRRRPLPGLLPWFGVPRGRLRSRYPVENQLATISQERLTNSEESFQADGMSWAKRKPTLLLRSSAWFPDRFETRKISRSLSQDPPRTTRWPTVDASVPTDLSSSGCSYLFWHHSQIFPARSNSP